MIDRDDGARPNSAARDASADFMAVFGGNDNRYTAADSASAGCIHVKACFCDDLGGIPIVESDILILDRGPGRTDGFGVAGLVVLVARSGVFGGDDKASRVARDLEAVAAVGADSDFLCGIDGRPHPRRGDDAALCGIGGPCGGDDFAAYGGGVGRGLGSTTSAGRGTGGQQCRYGQER